MDIEDLKFDLINIPPREKDGELHPFWRDIESKNLKSAMIFCLLTELRNAGFEIHNFSENQCRTILAKCIGYVTMLDLPDILANQKEKPKSSPEEKTPFDEFDPDFND